MTALLLAVVVFIGIALLTAMKNLLSDDIEQWMTSAAKWAVRHYVTKWHASRAERLDEQILADLADAHGVLHILKFAAGLWWGEPPGEPAPAENETDLPRSIVIEVANATIGVSAPPPTLVVSPSSTLSVYITEQIGISDRASRVPGRFLVRTRRR
jgi:hypothetical protein